jgi:hypothetical protein
MYKEVVDPAIQLISDATGEKFGSEFFHVAAREALHLAESIPGGAGIDLVQKFNAGGKRLYDWRLNVQSAGLHFDNPLMVGPGWTKTGDGLLALYFLGFAGGTAGTFTPEPQKGNPKPRQMMVAPGVSWNWLGLIIPELELAPENLLLLWKWTLFFLSEQV